MAATVKEGDFGKAQQHLTKVEDLTLTREFHFQPADRWAPTLSDINKASLAHRRVIEQDRALASNGVGDSMVWI